MQPKEAAAGSKRPSIPEEEEPLPKKIRTEVTPKTEDEAVQPPKRKRRRIGNLMARSLVVPPLPGLGQENRNRAGPAILGHVVSPGHFYLRLHDEVSGFGDLGKQLANHYKTANPMKM